MLEKTHDRLLIISNVDLNTTIIGSMRASVKRELFIPFNSDLSIDEIPVDVIVLVTTNIRDFLEKEMHHSIPLNIKMNL